MLASRPVVMSLEYLGDPVLEPLSAWLRRGLVSGLAAQLAAGDVPLDPGESFRSKLLRAE